MAVTSYEELIRENEMRVIKEQQTWVRQKS